MADDFNELWKRVRAVDGVESIRTLAKILSSKDGRTFVFNLEPSDVASCVEILDRVSLSLSIRHPSQLPTDVTIQYSGSGGTSTS